VARSKSKLNWRLKEDKGLNTGFRDLLDTRCYFPGAVDLKLHVKAISGTSRLTLLQQPLYRLCRKWSLGGHPKPANDYQLKTGQR
jgi:hypothetical protein